MRRRAVVLAALAFSVSGMVAAQPAKRFELIWPLGFSGNGLFAFAREVPEDFMCPECPRDVLVVVQNLVTDEIALEERVAAEILGDGGFEAWWRTSSRALLSRLRSLGIDGAQTGRAVAGESFVVGGWRYAALVEAGAAQVSVPGWGPPQPAPSLVDPRVLMTATNPADGAVSWKQIHRGPARREMTTIDSAAVAGVVVAPDSRRAAVIYSWTVDGDEAYRDFTVIGSHLVVGYQRGRPAPAQGRDRAPRISAQTLLDELERAANPEADAIIGLAVDATLAYLAGDTREFAPLTDPATGFYRLEAPGVIPVIERRETVPTPRPRARSVTRAEIAAEVTASDITMLDRAPDHLSRLVQYQIEPDEWDVEQLRTFERSIVAVVRVEVGAVQRLFVARRNGRLVVAIVDEVVPGEA